MFSVLDGSGLLNAIPGIMRSPIPPQASATVRIFVAWFWVVVIGDGSVSGNPCMQQVYKMNDAGNFSVLAQYHQ
jgi:hypothetical protein